jgi:hypothetical protein
MGFFQMYRLKAAEDHLPAPLISLGTAPASAITLIVLDGMVPSPAWDFSVTGMIWVLCLVGYIMRQ